MARLVTVTIMHPFLYGGKERFHAGGRNVYDFGARHLLPYGQWPSPDSKSESFYNISPFSYCAGDPINHVDKDGNFANLLTTLIGAGIGAIAGGGIEALTQLCNDGAINDWSAVAGAAVQGAVTGAVAGFTMGANLATTAAASGLANIAGGWANRGIQGEETTATDVAFDFAFGATVSYIGCASGYMVESYTNSLSNQAKGKLGEKVSFYKYTLGGNRLSRIAKIGTGEFRLNGTERQAYYDFKATNIFTGSHFIVESKFNTSGLTHNQTRAFYRADYPVIIDRTTSTQIGNSIRTIITGSGGTLGDQIERFR